MASTLELLERVELLQNILLSQATGGEAADEEYQKLRKNLLFDSTVSDALPRFVRTCLDLSQFWNFIKSKAGSYNERRQIIWDGFRPLISRLEEMDVEIRPPHLSKDPQSMESPPTVEIEEAHGMEPPPSVEPEGLQNSRSTSAEARGRPRVFIGHGRCLVWRELKDFLQDRLTLDWEEFNRESVAGVSTTHRLQSILNAVNFAFLVFTAEDEQPDGTSRARENVVHEAGLFQGKLGFERAIVLLEQGCATFSNIAGLTFIEFHKGKIGTCFEEVRRVLEREKLI